MTVTAEGMTGNGQRERGRHAANELQAGVKPVATAED